MVIQLIVQILGAALSMSPSYLIDKFLDWIEELSGTMVPAQVEVLVRIEERRDPFGA